MSSVTFSTTVGGDGSTVTDDDDATTGLRNGGWRTRFVPALAQEVAVAANAVASATASLSSKNAAAASASAASASASAASTSATNAANSATAAATSYDSFDDRYLGVKTSDPSVDNDGNALLVGALYWNSATSVFKVWSGSAWITNLTSNQFGTNVATFLQTPSSANLAAALTDETGTGSAVFANAPTFPAQINLTANSGYNIYATGTANNYLAGSTQFNSRISVGASSFTDTGVRLGGSIGTAATLNGIYQDITFPATTTASAFGYTTVLATAAAYTLPSLTHIRVYQGTFSGNVTTQYGFECSSSLTGATNNYGFYGGIASGTGRYNLYMAGTADNYLAGSLGIGGTPSAGRLFTVSKNLTGSANPIGVFCNGTVQSDATGATRGFATQIFTAPASFIASNIEHFRAIQGTIGAGSTVTTQAGFIADLSLIGATNNYGFYGNIASGTGRYNLYMAGTADNYLAGSLGIGTSSPNASAILDAQSTTKGVRFPNMTTTQKNAVSSPEAGLVVFDTTLSKLCVYSGAAWQTITSV